MSSKIRQLRRNLPCAETHSVECLHQWPGGVGMAGSSASINVLASGQRFAHVPPVWTRARLLSQILIHSTFKLCASLAQCAAVCPYPWPLSLGARFAFFILWLVKSEQFKLVFSLASSCGGYLGYILGHVLIINKKEIFHKPLSILVSSRSTYIGLGKNNKSLALFLNRIIQFCWNGSSPGWPFCCTTVFMHLFISLSLFSPRHIACFPSVWSASRQRRQHLAGEFCHDIRVLSGILWEKISRKKLIICLKN